jgi:hypothetical protein
MDLQASKIELVKEILNIDSPTLIHRVFDLLKTEEKEAFTLTPIEGKEVEIAIEQFDKGMRVPARGFLQKIS